jgi:hypothetical protein
MPAPLHSVKLQPTYKLGKLPAKHDARTLQLANYLAPTAIAPPPVKEDYEKKVKNWPMMQNDQLGDCTCACAGHMTEEWTTYAGAAFTPGDSAILKAYEMVGGYRPGQPDTDQGAVVVDVLNYWRRTGIAKHKILGYAALEPNNHNQVKDSVFLFGNCYLGIALPLSAQTQRVWAVPPGGAKGSGAPGSWGGHAVPVVAYNQRGLTVVTWGALKHMTWGFLDTYCDEAYAVLSQDWIDATKHVSPANFDLETLQADLKQIDKVNAAAAAAA